MATQSKLKYEKPRLVSLNSDIGSAAGSCQTGSGDTQNCISGNSAGNNCNVGNSANHVCGHGAGNRRN